MTVRVEHTDMFKGTQAESQELPGISWQQTVAVVGLVLIVLLGAFLRFYELGAYSIGNTYYAATVQSMLTSWHDFFFASFEPGGSVTVDKPPLGLWVQAISAYFLGVNGFALALPQALAGVLSIPLLYMMVKRQFGMWAGLIAALALAVTPVAISTERNNTMDGLLLFVLLLATWAFLRAVRLGRFRYLLLGTFLIGLGFNIKMLQAFLPLPALYALYLFGARHAWWKRIVHLAVATILLLVVSLSWAIAVDLTPAENRPYIGSSTNNTVMELIVGHNGLRRLGLMSGSGPARDDGPPSLPSNNAGQPGQPARRPPPPPGDGQARQFSQQPPPPGDGQSGQFSQQPPPPPAGTGHGPGNPAPAQPGPGNPPPPPGAGHRPGTPAAAQSGPGNPAPPRPGGPSQEVGEAALLRLFTEPLVTEASWLLPLALLGIPLVLMALGWQWPLSYKHLALVLWGGWLLPELLYFSFNSGLFHAYYLIMLGAPLAAVVAAVAWAIWRIFQRRPWLGWTLLALLAGVTVAFQAVTLQNYPGYATWAVPIAIALLVFGLGGLALSVAWRSRPWLSKSVLGIVLVATLIVPLGWSALTTFNANPNVALPSSGPNTGQSLGLNASNTLLSSSEQAILDYLLDNTDPDGYLVATPNARQAAPYILATRRPVLTFGGFKGSDDVIDGDQLAQMVADGELRFVLDQGLAREKPEIAEWLANNCTTVTIPGATQAGPARQQAFPPGRAGQSPPDEAGQVITLYDCGSYYAQAQ